MTQSGDSYIATRLKSSALELFFQFTSARIADSESNARYRESSKAAYLIIGGVCLTLVRTSISRLLEVVVSFEAVSESAVVSAIDLIFNTAPRKLARARCFETLLASSCLAFTISTCMLCFSSSNIRHYGVSLD